MKKTIDQNVTINSDSTMQQAVLSNPTIGYHTLCHLEGLKISYWDAANRIKEAEELTKGWEYERVAQLQKLRTYKDQLQSEFDFWSELVKNWVSRFPKKYAKDRKIIVDYYCNILNYSVGQKEPPDGALKLQDILDIELCGKKDRNKKSNNYHGKIRRITLNQIESR